MMAGKQRARNDTRRWDGALCGSSSIMSTIYMARLHRVWTFRCTSFELPLSLRLSGDVVRKGGDDGDDESL